MTTIYVVRHGETEWNRGRRIQGATDIPLNDTGREQARGAAQRLQALLAPTPVYVAASDLSRAQETAQIIAAGLGAQEVHTYEGLRERSYGDAEGMDIAEYYATYGPLGADGSIAEPWDAVRARALTDLARTVEDARASLGDDAQVVIVAHGGLIRELIRAASDDVYPLEGERLPNVAINTFILDDGAVGLVEYDHIRT